MGVSTTSRVADRRKPSPLRFFCCGSGGSTEQDAPVPAPRVVLNPLALPPKPAGRPRPPSVRLPPLLLLDDHEQALDSANPATDTVVTLADAHSLRNLTAASAVNAAAFQRRAVLRIAPDIVTHDAVITTRSVSSSFAESAIAKRFSFSSRYAMPLAPTSIRDGFSDDDSAATLDENVSTDFLYSLTRVSSLLDEHSALVALLGATAERSRLFNVLLQYRREACAALRNATAAAERRVHAELAFLHAPSLSGFSDSWTPSVLDVSRGLVHLSDAVDSIASSEAFDFPCLEPGPEIQRAEERERELWREHGEARLRMQRERTEDALRQLQEVRLIKLRDF